ncbi:MAG: hypothetical protein PHN56_04340 [Candidatus Nanoarchaeia archaeon]|nr:hypothetical protein [Candidatus Nanoarchaeia archaeon]
MNFLDNILGVVKKSLIILLIISVVCIILPLINNYVLQFASYASWQTITILIAGGVAVVCSIISMFSKIPMVPVLIILAISFLIALGLNLWVILTTFSLDTLLSGFGDFSIESLMTYAEETIADLQVKGEEAIQKFSEMFTVLETGAETAEETLK